MSIRIIRLPIHTFCLLLLLSTCAVRNGNGLIGNEASSPSCYIVEGNRVVFHDYRSKICSFRTGRIGTS